MVEEERQILRENFIEAIVRNLVINSYDPEKDQELKESRQKEKLNSLTEDLKKTNAMPAFHRDELLHNPQTAPQIKIHQGRTMPRVKTPIPLPQEPYSPSAMKPGQKIDTVNLGKISSVLIDPSVFSVECPGPNKNLLVNRSGSVQASSITLTVEEINAIMQNISDQTRIPITPGVFKAAVQDLVVTAVMSDFVGTRFMIQKRMPFQRY
jgi:hypothetical protein